MPAQLQTTQNQPWKPCIYCTVSTGLPPGFLGAQKETKLPPVPHSTCRPRKDDHRLSSPDYHGWSGLPGKSKCGGLHIVKYFIMQLDRKKQNDKIIFTLHWEYTTYITLHSTYTTAIYGIFGLQAILPGPSLTLLDAFCDDMLWRESSILRVSSHSTSPYTAVN